MTASKFRFRTIWFRNVCEKIYYSSEPANAGLGKKFTSKISPVKGKKTYSKNFINLPKAYGSEPKFRCRQFGTFGKNLDFCLAKLPLKS